MEAKYADVTFGMDLLKFLQYRTKYLEQIKEIQQIGQGWNTLISAFAYFLTAIAKVISGEWTGH